MKYLIIIFIFAGCNLKKDNPKDNNGLVSNHFNDKLDDSLVDSTCNKLPCIQDSIFEYRHHEYSVIIDTEMSKDSLLVDRAYVKNIKNQIAKFSINDSLIRMVELGLKQPQFGDNSKLNGFIYKIFTVPINEQYFVFVFDGLTMETGIENNEFRLIFEKDGTLIFNTFNNKDEIDKIEDFWNFYNITFDILRRRNQYSKLMTF